MLPLSNTSTNKTEHYPKLPDGAYLVEITGAWDAPQSNQVVFTFEIAEGEYKGCMAEWDKSFPRRRDVWHNHCITASYISDKAKEWSAKAIDAIGDSNPGFDARAAWDDACTTGDLSAFVGKHIGVIIKGRNYIDRNGIKRFDPNNVQMVVKASDLDGVR